MCTTGTPIQVPILADLQMNGETRKVMMWANRNAFFYTLDRETGEFLIGKPFATQTWAEGLDSNGRPIRVPDTFPTPEGTLVSPPVGGGTNWFSPAYSPRTELFYVQAFDGEATYFKRDEQYNEGDRYTGGGMQYNQPMDSYQSAIRAIDPKTGDIRWEYQIQARSTAGVMATAGDLVFTRKRRRLLLRARRGQRPGALAHERRQDGALRPDELRGRRDAVCHHCRRQCCLHVWPEGLRR